MLDESEYRDRKREELGERIEKGARKRGEGRRKGKEYETK